MKKRILVTGGAGFLGSHLCDRLLADGHEVVCLDDFSTGAHANVSHLLNHPAFEVVCHDVRRALAMEMADQIYHLACPASPVHYQRDPVRTIRTIVEGTSNLLNVARGTGARVLIASTSEVYGDPAEHPQTETYWGNVNPIGPRACYDEGKRCAEALATAYANQYGLAVYIPRIFNTYGPRMHENDGRVVSNFVVQALAGTPLTVFGTGSQTRSFCYVSDLIEGLVRLMASDHGCQPVNLGNPHETTMLELATLIKELTGSSSEIVYKPLPEDDPVRRNPDISLARRLLNDWTPRVFLTEGLQATIAYFRSVLS